MGRTLRALWLACGALGVSAGPNAATELRTEYMPDPRVIDTPTPRFYWTATHTDRGVVQSGGWVEEGGGG